MQFAASRPDVVRSVCQRWLLKYWTRLRGFKPMPAWKDLPVEDLSRQLDTLMFLDVVANGAEPRFRIRFLGKRIAQSYGGDFTGRFLDEAIPPAWRDNAMKTYQQGRHGTARRSTTWSILATATARSCTWSGCCCRSPANGAIAPTGVLASIETLEHRRQVRAARARQLAACGSPVAAPFGGPAVRSLSQARRVALVVVTSQLSAPPWCSKCRTAAHEAGDRAGAILRVAMLAKLERLRRQLHHAAGAGLDALEVRRGLRQHALHEEAAGDELGLEAIGAVAGSASFSCAALTISAHM